MELGYDRSSLFRVMHIVSCLASISKIAHLQLRRALYSICTLDHAGKILFVSNQNFVSYCYEGGCRKSWRSIIMLEHNSSANMYKPLCIQWYALLREAEREKRTEPRCFALFPFRQRSSMKKYAESYHLHRGHIFRSFRNPP